MELRGVCHLALVPSDTVRTRRWRRGRASGAEPTLSVFLPAAAIRRETGPGQWCSSDFATHRPSTSIPSRSGRDRLALQPASFESAELVAKRAACAHCLVRFTSTSPNRRRGKQRSAQLRSAPLRATCLWSTWHWSTWHNSAFDPNRSLGHSARRRERFSLPAVEADSLRRSAGSTCSIRVTSIHVASIDIASKSSAAANNNSAQSALCKLAGARHQ